MVFAISGEAVWPDTNPGRNRRDQALTAILRFLRTRADGTDRPRWLQPGDDRPVAAAAPTDTGEPSVWMDARFEGTADQVDAWTSILANLAAASTTRYRIERHACPHDETAGPACVVELEVTGP